MKNKLVVSLDSSPRKIDDIDILPWEVFLDKLWQGDFSLPKKENRKEGSS